MYSERLRGAKGQLVPAGDGGTRIAAKATEAEREQSIQSGEQISDDDSKNNLIGKDELENFILSGQGPSYEDLTFDFKELLIRKRKGETWMEIAQSLKVSSSKLSSDWSEYKKRVKTFLAGEENGAA